jgi:predicted DNA-binding transcriptional regulator AlpA
MKKPMPLLMWQSSDAAFALGVFSRAPGTDVLYDLTINQNLDLLPRPLDGLRAILSRIDLEANMIEAMDPPPWSDTRPTFRVSWLDLDAIATTCDAAIATDSELHLWYCLGCSYADWFLSPGKDELRQLKTAIWKLPESVSQSPIAKVLEFTLVDGLPSAESVRGLLGSDADREIETMLRWDMVLAQGEWIRETSASILRTVTLETDIHDAAQADVELHNKDRVCELLGGVTTKHVDNLVRQGRMPRPVYLGRSPRWRSDELRTWIKAGCPVVDEVRFSQFEEEKQTASCT